MTPPDTPDTPIERCLAGLSRACVVIAGVALVVLIAIFGWLVFGRYVLNATPTWVEQLALVLIVLITFLMAAVGVRENTHLAVTFIRDALPGRLRNGLVILADLTLAGFGAVMMVQGMKLVEFGWSTRLALLNVPEGVRTVPVVACGILMMLFAGARAGRRLLGRDGEG